MEILKTDCGERRTGVKIYISRLVAQEDSKDDREILEEGHIEKIEDKNGQ